MLFYLTPPEHTAKYIIVSFVGVAILTPKSTKPHRYPNNSCTTVTFVLTIQQQRFGDTTTSGATIGAAAATTTAYLVPVRIDTPGRGHIRRPI